MDVRYLDHTQKCEECGSNALITDGTITWCSVIGCNWVKPYKTNTNDYDEQSKKLEKLVDEL